MAISDTRDPPVATTAGTAPPWYTAVAASSDPAGRLAQAGALTGAQARAEAAELIVSRLPGLASLPTNVLKGAQVLGQQGSVPNTVSGRTTEAEAQENELRLATGTLRLSGKVADSFTFYGLTGRGKYGRVPVDGKFWFSKIYEIITYEEISARHRRRFPSFMLHFIPIFYDLYYQALQSRLQKQSKGVSELWDAHFTVTEKEPNTNVIVEYTDHITNCIVSGVKAHILGDMATALEQSYRSYVTRYPTVDLQFDDLLPDYFEVDPEVFRNVPPPFFAYLSNLALPFPSVALGQYILGAANELIRGLPIEAIVEWRSEVWKRAREALRT